MEVSPAEGRRIAVRAQLLDGSATDVLSTVRQLGFLQIDPISTVAPPQYLVLWSRLGSFDRTELDRLLWDERKLIEWNAFIWPVEDLPILKARMRRRRTKYKWERRVDEFLKENAGFKRYVLRELERRGPLLSRELEDRSRGDEDSWSEVWWGSRNVTQMLETLHLRGQVAIVGRRTGQRIWDLAERWYPETETLPIREAEGLLAEKRFRALGLRSEKGRWLAHPGATGGPVRNRVTFLSPFDRLVHDRDRTEALWGFRYRLEMYVPQARREYGYYVLPILHGDRLVGRIEPIYDRKAGVLQVKGVFAQPDARESSGPGVAHAVKSLAKWVGAKDIAYSRRVPSIWRDSLRN